MSEDDYRDIYTILNEPPSLVFLPPGTDSEFHYIYGYASLSSSEPEKRNTATYVCWLVEDGIRRDQYISQQEMREFGRKRRFETGSQTPYETCRLAILGCDPHHVPVGRNGC